MSGAIFLSYASQDAEAANRICEALRAAGVEVWFDQSELVGGDAWDAKIKRQIRDCVLFLPVISERTQLRREGYFRLEWHLADERSRLIARGTPFLVPVVIDDTGERDALVPDSFLAIQWTRLPNGVANLEFVNRVRSLLSGIPAMPNEAEPRNTVPVPVQRRRGHGWVAAGTIAGIVVAGGLIWRYKEQTNPSPQVPSAADVASTKSAGNAEGFPSDPDLRRAMGLIKSNTAIPEDYSLAEDIANSTLSKNPTEADAVVVMALIQDAFLYRGFDRSPGRYASAKRFAERGAQLAPDNAYAQCALGIYLFQQGNSSTRSEQVLNLAISLNPKEPMFYKFRDDALFADPKVSSAAAMASAERSSALFPRDALLHYELSRHYRDVGRIGDMERELDATIAIEPIVNALVWKARVALWVRGDPDEMMAILNRIPGRGSSTERVVLGHWIYSMATGKVQDGLDALDSLPETWVDDFDYVGPKLALEAALVEIQGHRELAQIRWAAALAEIRRREAATPDYIDLRLSEAWCLHGLGSDQEARAILQVYIESLRRPFHFGFGNSWWFSAIPCCLLLGERTTALQLMREAVSQDSVGTGTVIVARGSNVTRSGFLNDYRQVLMQDMRVDPRMAPWRDDPEIKTLLSTPAEPNH
jgi:tetratricopeptide (TPR) repeat protein